MTNRIPDIYGLRVSQIEQAYERLRARAIRDRDRDLYLKVGFQRDRLVDLAHHHYRVIPHDS